MIRQQISLTNRLTHQSTPLTNKRRQWWTRAENCRLKSEPPLMRGLNIHKSIPVSITKLTLGLRVGFISSHLIVDKLFPINPRAIAGPKMSLLLDAKSMPALMIKPRFILVMHMDDLGWYITSDQPGKMFIQNLNRIVWKPNVTPSQFPYCTTDSIPIDLIFQENFPNHTQVWNCLSSYGTGTAWALQLLMIVNRVAIKTVHIKVQIHTTNHKK